MQQILDNFLDSMVQRGCSPAGSLDIVADNKWHYYQLDGDKRGKKAGAYSLVIEGEFAYGCFLNRRDGEIRGWSYLPDRKITKEEREYVKRRMDEVRREKDAERQQQWEDIAAICTFEISCAKPATADHPYLANKGLEPTANVYIIDDELIIPRQDRFGSVWSYQRILPNGMKFYYAGGRTKETYHAIGAVEDKVVICEGWATGKSIYDCTGFPVMVAFDAGNLMSVAKVARVMYPAAHIVMAADNDAWRTNEKGELENIGYIKACEAAAVVGGFTVMPRFKPENLEGKPTDFDDLRQLEGIDAVCAIFDEIAWPDEVSAADDIPLDFDDLDIKRANSDDVDWLSMLIPKSSYKDGGLKEAKNIGLNMYIILKHHPACKGVFSYDLFERAAWIERPGGIFKADNFERRKLTEDDTRTVDYFFQKLDIGLGDKEGATRGAIKQISLDNAYHPLRDWFDTLQWDGIPRLDNWLIEYCHATFDPAEYVRAIGKTWMVAGVARTYEPAAKFDHMLIFEGDQARGKSTAMEILGTIGFPRKNYYTNQFNIKNCTTSNELDKLRGKFLVEISEMANFNKADRDELTSFITSRYDTYRAAYDRDTIEHPRQYILAGTYNPTDGIFSDPTGYRRYWCVTVGNINLAQLRLDVDQLWAEAVAAYKAGYKIELHTDFYDLAREVNSTRVVQDEWMTSVLRYARSHRWVQTTDILTDALKIEIAKQTGKESKRVNKILQQAGWRREQRRAGLDRVWGWVRPDKYGVPDDEEKELEL